MLIILHRHVANLVPLHQEGHHLEKFILLHREELGGHVVFHLHIILGPTARFIQPRQTPTHGRAFPSICRSAMAAVSAVMRSERVPRSFISDNERIIHSEPVPQCSTRS